MTPQASSALLTDMYELTMLQAALADGTAERRCVFEVFTRRLPSWRRYGVLAGTGRILELLESFHFGPRELDFLATRRVVDDRTLTYLADYRFQGDMVGYREGETYFPGSPVLTVEGTFAESVLLETLLLSILNYDSAVAAAASRMTSAAGDRPCLDMGARRANEGAAVAAARAAVVGGFMGTSNLEAGLLWDIPTIGTAAHAFTLVHDDEPSAFASQVASLGASTTLLVDTYNVRAGVEEAVAAGGTELGAVRLDSGDLATLAEEVRAQLDSHGATSTRITVTSDLDEYAIAALAAAPVDSYGVGTRLVTGSGAPTSSMVYKMVAREGRSGRMEPVAKASMGKTSVGGRKVAMRQLDDDDRAVAEVVFAAPQAPTSDASPHARALQIPLVINGVIQPGYTGPEGLRAATLHHRTSLAELPRAARRLSSGEPVIPTKTIAAK